LRPSEVVGLGYNDPSPAIHPHLPAARNLPLVHESGLAA